MAMASIFAAELGPSDDSGVELLLRRLAAANATSSEQAVADTPGPVVPLSARTNLIAAVILLTVVAVTGASALFDVKKAKKDRQSEAGPWRWAINLKVVSYVLLVPGLFHILYHYNVSLSFFGQTWNIRKGSESVFRLIRDLHNYDCNLAAFLVAFYAIVIPVVKILLLIVGHCWKHSLSPSRVLWARRALVVVQQVSKWASPDMFAYILMMHLFREVNQPPSVLSDMTLDVGFTCFCIFCVGSTVSALGIHVPPKPASLEKSSTPAKVRMARARRTAAAVVTLAIVFAALLVDGITRPCMGLAMDMDLFYVMQPNLIPFKAYIDSVHLEDLVHAEVSIWQCMISLGKWLGEGEVNSGIALVMYGVFVISFTVADVAANLIASFLICRQGGALAAKPVLAAGRVMRKLCMLDVSVVGILVIVLAMQNLRGKGITVSVKWGIAPLCGAVVCQYLATFLIKRAYRALIQNQDETQEVAKNDDNTVEV
eukprot:TRINITY_DN9453_c0_g1_i6.p1 TRINITY_DN9453_c0_g1~~TRINITY_DN9453_c0_g1_i6.p1  ORF type:complete len:498 (+),score=69.25 TRINITY_DN9453_c0_g1_i6:42-1496(+)